LRYSEFPFQALTPLDMRERWLIKIDYPLSWKNRVEQIAAINGFHNPSWLRSNLITVHFWNIALMLFS